MQPSMTFLATVSSGPSGTRRVRISLPLFRSRSITRAIGYRTPLPPPEGQDLRGLPRPKIGNRPARRRGALWTSHDQARTIRRRRDRDEAELADVFGDPP